MDCERHFFICFCSYLFFYFCYIMYVACSAFYLSGLLNSMLIILLQMSLMCSICCFLTKIDLNTHYNQIKLEATVS